MEPAQLTGKALAEIQVRPVEQDKEANCQEFERAADVRLFGAEFTNKEDLHQTVAVLQEKRSEDLRPGRLRQ